MVTHRVTRADRQLTGLDTGFNPHPVVTHRVTMAFAYWALPFGFQSTPGGDPPGDYARGQRFNRIVMFQSTPGGGW